MLRMNREAQAFAESVIATLGCAPILRVRVIGGGCAGLTWDFAVGDESTRPGDRKRRNGPLDVVVDGISAPLVDGALIELGEPGASGQYPRPRNHQRISERNGGISHLPDSVDHQNLGGHATGLCRGAT
jgi:Fe-S cluster assembly iron-binding protein IscA